MFYVSKFLLRHHYRLLQEQKLEMKQGFHSLSFLLTLENSILKAKFNS